MKALRLPTVMPLALAAAALAGCAAGAPESATGGPESWRDCVFNDGSVGHMQMKDCVAQGGRQRAPLLGPEIAYRVTVDWEGETGPLLGTLSAPEYGHAGPLSITLRSIDRECAGTFRTLRTPRGVWSVACEDGLTASGTLYRYGIRHALVGNGLDSNGNEIDFEAMPSRP